MTKTGKRRLLRLLSVCLALLCLGSCGTGGHGGEGTSGSRGQESGTAAAPTGSVLELMADYTIVYPDEASDGEIEAMNRLYAALGSPIDRIPRSDHIGWNETIPSGNYEILVGQTNRQASQTALNGLVRNRDWSVSVGKNEIVIAARSSAAVIEAADWFIANMLPADASSYAEGYIYSYEHTYALSTFFGMIPSGVVIGYSGSALQDAAELLSAYVTDRTGERAPLNDDGSGTVRLIVDESMDIARYSLTSGSAEILIKGGSAVAVEEAVKAIVVEEKGGVALNLSGESTIPVTLSDLRNNGDTLELVWHDEFDTDSLNADKWKLYDRMFGSHMATETDEEHIRIEDGKIIMNAYSEGNGRYSTHKTLTTTGKMSFLYGYVEIRARFSFIPGSFPSFWFQSAPEHRTADYMTEVDMFEPYFYGYMESAIHKWYLAERADGFGSAYAHDWCEPERFTLSGFGDYWCYWNYKETPTITEAQRAAIEAWNESFHTFGFGWTSEVMYFTVDGTIVGEFDLTSGITWNRQNLTGNASDSRVDAIAKDTGMGGFINDPLFINFTNWISTGTGFRFSDYVASDDTTYPLTFEVDYVRLYQKPGEGQIFYD